MSLSWLLFASLSVAGSLIYNVCTKLGSTSANAFGFTFLMSVTVLAAQGLFCLIAKYGFKVDWTQGINPQTMRYALFAGLAVTVIDFSYFFALRYGSLIASQLFWTVGGTVALATFAVLFMGESMTTTKCIGIAFGIASVFLISFQP